MSKKKHPGGRPLKFPTPEAMQEKIDEYFKECDENTKAFITKDGDVMEVPQPIPYTIEGLAVALGVDRVTLLNYEKRDEFFSTIRSAKDKVLRNMTERSLIGDNVASVSIFLLKNNYGYRDTQHVEQETTTFEKPKVVKLDKESLKELKKDLGRK